MLFKKQKILKLQQRGMAKETDHLSCRPVNTAIRNVYKKQETRALSCVKGVGHITA